MIPHRRWSRNPKTAPPGEQPDFFPSDRLAKGELRLRKIREEFAKRAGVDYRPRQAVFSERGGLLEYADGELPAFPPGEVGQLDRARESGRTRSDKKHIELDGIGTGRLRPDQAIEWKRGLMPDRYQLGHAESPDRKPVAW
jgi:hypothetical protein